MNPSKPQIVSTDYNKMAPFYSLLTHLISGGGNTRAQRYFLEYIAPHERVLHIGCGSVGFNVDLAGRCRNVTAVDISPRMIEIAGQKVSKHGVGEKIAFVCKDIMEYHPPKPYDVVLANFFLNTFTWEDCAQVITHIASLVKPGGRLCIADETFGTHWTTKLTLICVRPIIEWLHHLWAKQPMHAPYDYTDLLKSLGFRRVCRKRDQSDYILSSIYQR